MNLELEITQHYLVKRSKQMCRVCLTENIEGSKCVFDEIEYSTIAFMVMSCAQVQITCQDGLPDIICAQCLGDLEAANGFRLRCELADALLRKSYSCTSQENVRKPVQHTKTLAPVKREVLPADWFKSELKNNSDSDAQDDPLIELSDRDDGENYAKKSSHQTNLASVNSDLPSLKTEEIENNRNIIQTIEKDSKSETTNLFRCKKCSFSSASQRKLILHSGAHASKKPLQCDICRTKCPSAEYLKSHRAVCTGLNLSKCFYCRASYANFNQYKIHKMFCKGNELYKRRIKEACLLDADDRGFKRTAENLYECEFCSRSFDKKHIFIYHLNQHTDKPYKCDVCKIRFVDYVTLMKHRKRCPDNFECRKCGKSYKYKNSFRRHQKVHSKVYVCTCEICGKQLSCKRILKIHLKRHMNIRNFPCKFCSRSFVDRGDLAYHIKMHTDPKKYECDYCGHKTRLKRALIGHFMLHEGEKNTKCQLCDYKCYDNPSLQRHMLSHSDERKYTCPLCNMKFKINQHVNRHMLRIHKVHYRVGEHTDRRVIK